MPKTISAGLESHLAEEVTTLTTLWRIIRTDGQEFFFTDHDTDIDFDGNTYESAYGYNRTAVSNRVGLSVDSLEAHGFLDSSALTEIELRAGLFDYAQVYISVVNYANLAQGALQVRKGRFGEIVYSDSGVFKTELRGLAQAYSQNIVELFSPHCRADLGDDRCQIPINPDVVERNTAYEVGDYVRETSTRDNRIYRCTVAGTTDGSAPTYDDVVGNTTNDGTATFIAEEAWTRAGTVATVTDNRTFSITVDEVRAVDDWFKYGVVLWDTGNNAGLAMEVKSSQADATTGTTTLDVDDNNTFSRASGSFVSDGFEVGMKIVTTGFTDGANNGTFTVSAVNALTLDIEETTLVAESGGGNEDITAPDGVTLFLAMPFEIQVGDTLGIYAGCNKTLNTCVNKFDNIINFRGEPYVPGPDALYSIKTRTGQVVESGKG